VAAKGTFVRLLAPPVEGRVVRGEQGLDVGDQTRVRLVATDQARALSILSGCSWGLGRLRRPENIICARQRALHARCLAQKEILLEGLCPSKAPNILVEKK